MCGNLICSTCLFSSLNFGLLHIRHGAGILHHYLDANCKQEDLDRAGIRVYDVQ